MSQGTTTRVSPADLGIDVRQGGEQVFYWLLCVLLFSKPIQQEIAGDAFKRLRQRHFDTPARICRANWSQLVAALGAAHYVRYDESTATRLQEASQLLLDEYDGDIMELIEACADADELHAAVQQFNGIGPTGADIFLREVGPVYFSGQSSA